MNFVYFNYLMLFKIFKTVLIYLIIKFDKNCYNDCLLINLLFTNVVENYIK